MKRYKLISKENFPEHNCRASLYRHTKSGADILHLGCDDKENFFGFAFKTVPEKSNGAPHILEHTVLSGSKNYPLKDAFQALMQGSAYTFLNAMTYSDRTLYPAGSTIEKDFFNLLSVYGDAVFFPLLTKEAFQKEGWRYEYDRLGNLLINGVVYNEMKGCYSSEEEIIGELSIRSLFPNTPYQFDSGGDPDTIRTITWEELKAYHKKYYHPSNSLTTLYGSIPAEKSLPFLADSFFDHFDVRSPLPDFPLQQRWKSPGRIEEFFPSARGEKKGTVSLNWLLDRPKGIEDIVKLTIFDEALLGNDGSPLRKEILALGLCDDISHISGMETSLREPVYTVAVKGILPNKRDEFQERVLNILEKIEKNPPFDLLDGAFNKTDFFFKEVRSSYGLRLIKRAAQGWGHDYTPLSFLRYQEKREEVEAFVKESQNWRDFIRKGLIENSHRLLATAIPDPRFFKKREALLKKELKNIKPEPLLEEEIDVSSFNLPHIAIDDLPKEVDKIETTETSVKDVTVYQHHFFTANVLYVDLYFNLSLLDPELFPLLPLFGRSFTGLGLESLSYDNVAAKIAQLWGGYSVSPEASLNIGGKELLSWLLVRVKVSEEKLTDGLALLRELFISPDIGNRERLSQMLDEMKSRMKASIIPAGSSYAGLRSETRFSQAAVLEEQWEGISWYRKLRRGNLDSPETLPQLERIYHYLLKEAPLACNITGSKEGAKKALSNIEPLFNREQGAFSAPLTADFSHLYSHRGAVETINIPTNVGYAACTLKAPKLKESDEYVNALLLSQVLKTGPLWESLRTEGGAYGASAIISPFEGVFTVSSYRDPTPERSISLFKSSLEQVRESLSESELEKAIIGSVGKDIRPLSPGMEGYYSTRRALLGLSHLERQKKRDLLLAANVKKVKESADYFLSHWDSAAFTILVGKERQRFIKRLFENLISSEL